MTQEEYKIISEALSDLQRHIENSFDKFIDNIKSLKDEE